jgi:hypothetical protein
VALVVASVLLLVAARWSSASKSDAPRQPIDFSHLIHAGDDRLSCDLCHSGARRSPFAGVAPVERCMGCHRAIDPDNPEVTKLYGFWERNEPIPWVRVYVLPRFVHFDHEAHTRAGVACGHCHGDVPRMARVARVTDLTMGWCVECHRSRGAPDDCLTCHY